MKLGHLFLFLAGHRESILAIARTPRALAVGFLLVMTGAVARNYDGADMLHEWHVWLHGVGVSTFNALVLFALIALASRPRPFAGGGFWRGYLVFLALIWMTTPMAWLYAVPYERWMTPIGAIDANGRTLAVVSLWRVLLISRVLSVIFGTGFWRVLWVVLAFSAAAVFIGAITAPVPVAHFMGGMQYAPEETQAWELNLLVTYGSFLAFWPFALGAVVSLVHINARWAVGDIAGPGPRRGVWVLIMAAWGAMAGLLVAGQPQQWRRREAEKLLVSGHVREALAEMSRHERGDYPRFWDIPPRGVDYRPAMTPTVDAIRAALTEPGAAPWARAMLLEKSWRASSRHVLQVRRPAMPSQFEEHMADKMVMSQTYDEGEDLAASLRFHLEHDDRFSDVDRAIVREWLKRAASLKK